MKIKLLEIKSEEQKLEYLNNLTYRIIFLQKNGHFFLMIPQLGISVKGTSIADAHAALELKKNDYFKSMIEAGAEAEIIFPDTDSDIFAERRIILKNAFRYTMVFLFWVGTAFITAKTFTKTMDRGIGSIVKKYESVNSVDPVKKEQRIMRFRDNLNELKPYIDEIKKVLK